MAPDIIKLMARHVHYCEPFAGGLAVLMARNPDDESLWLPPHKGVSEVVNDLNGGLTNFWRVLQGNKTFPEFQRMVQAVPFSHIEFNGAVEAPDLIQDHPVESAVNFFIRCRQSRSGMMKSFTSTCRNRTRRGMNGNVSEWLGAIEGLADVHARLQRVLVDNIPAVEFIQREDVSGALHYLDPPYVSSTRSSKNLYVHEMTEKDHLKLLDTAKQCKGKVMISGYTCTLYQTALKDWNRHDFDLPNNPSGGKRKDRETEVLWLNY